MLRTLVGDGIALTSKSLWYSENSAVLLPGNAESLVLAAFLRITSKTIPQLINFQVAFLCCTKIFDSFTASDLQFQSNRKASLE